MKIKKYPIKGTINFNINRGIFKKLILLNLIPKEIILNNINAKINGIIICKTILDIVFKTEPSTGTNNKAINNDEVRTQIRVIGKYFMNSPAIPGQNIRGKKAAKVVAVEDIMGSAIFFDAVE